MSLYKFTHISLLTNNAQLKQNKVKKAKRESERVIHLNLLKKSCHEKEKKKKKDKAKCPREKSQHCPRPEKSKEKMGRGKVSRKENK